MRELKPGLAHRTARTAPLRYKFAGGAVSGLAYVVVVPLLSILIDPSGESVLAFAGITLASAVLLVWGYYVATGMLARRRVLD